LTDVPQHTTLESSRTTYIDSLAENLKLNRGNLRKT